MRKRLLCGLLLLLPLALPACGEKQDTTGDLKTTAPIDNNSPAAANAKPEGLAPGQVLPGGKRPSGGG